jgi:predicted TPR repeat methyltransferase
MPLGRSPVISRMLSSPAPRFCSPVGAMIRAACGCRTCKDLAPKDLVQQHDHVPSMSSRIKLRKQKWGGLKKGPPTTELLAAAIKKHQEGQPEEAAKIYREILAASPDNVDALHFLGVAEHQLGHSDRALEHISRALAEMPDHPDALNNRGNILKKLGRLDEAERDYRRTLELRPGDPNTRNNLGTIQRERGDLAGAIATYREVIAAKPDHVPAWQNLGNTLGDLNRTQEALDAHYEAMRLAPQSADSYRYLGRILYAEGRLAEATDVYRRWLAIFPDDPRAQHFAAACTGKCVPSRASDDYVRAEFDGFASTFDGTLARLEYQAPRLVADEVARLYGHAEPRLAVIDAGCGTGLCGPLLRPRAAFMAGVDLSAAMIELARKRAVYDALVVAELTAYLLVMIRSAHTRERTPTPSSGTACNSASPSPTTTSSRSSPWGWRCSSSCSRCWPAHRQRALPGRGPLLDPHLRHQLRRRRGHRHSHGIPVRHQLGAVQPARGRRHRPNPGHGRHVRLLPRIQLPRPAHLGRGEASGARSTTSPRGRSSSARGSPATSSSRPTPSCNTRWAIASPSTAASRSRASSPSCSTRGRWSSTRTT